MTNEERTPMSNDTILLQRDWFGDPGSAVLGYSGTDADQIQKLVLFKVYPLWVAFVYSLKLPDGKVEVSRSWVKVGEEHRTEKLIAELKHRYDISIAFDQAEVFQD
jgi:hypothetical protein